MKTRATCRGLACFVLLISSCFLSYLDTAVATSRLYSCGFLNTNTRNIHTKWRKDSSYRVDTYRRCKTSEPLSPIAVRLTSDRIPERLVQSLDLAPVIRLLSKYAGTRRGRHAILGLIGEERNAERSLVPSSNWDEASSSAHISSNRRRAMRAARLAKNDNIGQDSQSRQSLSPIASCADQARMEYELVEQASLALHGRSNHGLAIPPIYGATSSPWDTDTIADTDHDDWIELSLDEWTMEHVMQAEQVIQTLLQVREWGSTEAAVMYMPALAETAQSITESELRLVYQDIQGAVEIVKSRSYMESQPMAYKFQLNEDRFPSLKILREKERVLHSTVENEIRTLLRRLKGTPEVVEHGGRTVLCVPKHQANGEVGIIRGTLDNGRRCYVEPHSCVESGNELAAIRNDLVEIEDQVLRGLMDSIHRALPAIDKSLHAMARLDVVFAKAAYAKSLHGSIPQVGHEGRIFVQDFVHPLLANRKGISFDDAVPIDLILSDEEASQVLIISGPNGGGKTIALKSFGLVALLSKLAIPIPRSSTSAADVIYRRVDFFDDVLVDVGDQQSVLEGESTLMAKLNVFSSVIDSVTGNVVSETAQSDVSLVLLDELGGGTDPAAGGALAQAVLEKLLESKHCRIVATTHSPRLKALSYNSPMFRCAKVLLTIDPLSDFKRPSYKLEYGSIGDSYALGAASRCSPPLPDDVLKRAASLMVAASTSDETACNGDQAESVDYLRALTSSLERQKEAAILARTTWETNSREVQSCRVAMAKLAETYSKHWNEVEQRLQEMFQELRNDESKDAMEVVGETVETLKIVKRKVKTEEDLLKEHGLKRVSPDHEFHSGESVVILSSNEWEGTTGTVVANDGLVGNNDIAILPASSMWNDPFFSLEGKQGADDGDGDRISRLKPLIVKRSEVAVWDTSGVWDDFDNDAGSSAVTSVRDARQRLNGLLSTLTTRASTTNERGRAVSSSNGEKSSLSQVRNFKSARQRKAARSRKRKKSK